MMKIHTAALIALLSTVFAACSADRNTTPNKAAPASPTAVPTMVPTPADGDYDGRGTVTKINLELGSIELDHEDIPGLMPAMRMEFLVTDRSHLNGLKVGDRVDFVLRHKGSSETLVLVTKGK